MEKLQWIKSKSLFFLISGIFLIGAVFIFISCGAGPFLKVFEANKGAFAIDLSLAPAPSTFAAVYTGNANFPSIAGNELTIEAWVKSKTATLSGGIFSRYDAAGIVMWVKNNVPKFAIRIATSPTSTDYTVSSGDTTTLTDGQWHHIAGVLVNSAHTSHATSTTCTTTVRAETPHVDIYVDGVFKDCATTSSQGANDPNMASVRDVEGNTAQIGLLDPQYTPYVDSISSSPLFQGVIDEVRLWTVARTQAQIQACMYQELSLTGGDCGIDFTILKGYWRFNEGTGSDIIDSSGHGSNGWIESPSGISWVNGWASGYPF